MKLTVVRKYRKSNYTIGELLIDDKYFCDTLEDADRGLTSTMTLSEIKARKIPGKTAIPLGTYKLNMKTVSPKFKSTSWGKAWKGIVPRLMKVPGYTGVLIHPLNWPEDTEGCLGVGENKVKGGIINSRIYYDKLMNVLMNTKEDIWIEYIYSK